MTGLARMFKEMADRQNGLSKAFKTSFSYTLVETARAKKDAEGRDMRFSFAGGVHCYDLTKADRFPVLVAGDGTKSLIVKAATCKGCEHYGTVPFCALHWDRNKTLITDTLKKAGEGVARIMGTAP